MKKDTLLRELEIRYNMLSEKLRMARRNAIYYIANQDYITASYWDVMYKETWIEYEKVVNEYNKLSNDES